MDLRAEWDRLKATAGDAGSGAFRRAYEGFVSALAASPECGPALGVDGGRARARRLAALRDMAAGRITTVGALAQLETAVLAALFHVAQGKRVFILTGMPADQGLVRALADVLARNLDVRVKSVASQFGTIPADLQEVAKADLSVWDYPQFVRTARARPGLVKERPSVVVFCEVDLCLYDARLFLFEEDELRATAAIGRTAGKEFAWKDQKGVLDFKDFLPQFEAACGVTSALSPDVAAELATVYSPPFEGIKQRGFSAFPAMVFRTAEEKIRALCKSVMKADGDALVFYHQEPTRQAITEELKKQGQEALPMMNATAFKDFLTMGGAGKRVALVCGLPNLLTPPLADRGALNAFVAEPFGFPHHHAKLRAFLDARVTLKAAPFLYYSLEDGQCALYAQERSFATCFDLIAFTEKWDERRQVRRVVARYILNKVYQRSRALLTEEMPIFSVIFPARVRGKGTGKMRRKIGKHLEGLCFCGSGKPFKQCHGKG